MYVLQEENKDLREDLDRVKAISYDQKIKEMASENTELRKRNGHLLIQLDDMKQKVQEAKDQLKNQTATQAEQHDIKARPTAGLVRPQTAAGAFGRKKEDLQMIGGEDLNLYAQNAFDKELNELLAKN